MSTTSAAISGAASTSSVPATAMSNQELERRLDTSDEWIKSRTGIGQRYLLRSGESLVEIAAQASRKALDRAGLKAGEIEAIVAGTVSSDYAFPSFACQLQYALGLDGIPAFDVAAACSGFVYALSVTDSMMRAGDFKRVLLVGTDALSTMVDWGDRSTCVLFGDGAGAVVMVTEPGEHGVLGTVLRSSGKLADLLAVRATGFRAPANSERRRDPDDAMKMRGPELFKAAIRGLEEATRAVVAQAGLKLDDLALVIPHQANLRIMEATAKKLHLSPERMVSTVDKHANTSAASIPLALDLAVRDGRIRSGQHVMLLGVGGGFTWGSVLLRW